jgi:polyhydroxyalkanoate synthesis regulator phasin
MGERMSDIVEINVQTGEVTTRSYTQAEKDRIQALEQKLAEMFAAAGENNGN